MASHQTFPATLTFDQTNLAYIINGEINESIITNTINIEPTRDLLEG